ncbi:hypothetical protein ACPC3D_09170 [Streptomyces cellulosae]
MVPVSGAYTPAFTICSNYAPRKAVNTSPVFDPWMRRSAVDW